MDSLETRLKQKARDLGFELAGIAPAGPADHFDKLRDWLDQGYAGEMLYMHRHAEARHHPTSILPNVQSVVMVGMNYYVPARPETTKPSAGTGRVARYALGEDYHDVLRARLGLLLDWISAQVPD